MNYIYVFDYSVPAIYEIPFDFVEDNIEDVLAAHEIKESECEWMAVQNKLELETLEYKVIKKENDKH